MSRFRLEAAPAGPPGSGEIVHLVMDDPVRAANVLDGPALDDLDAALGELEARPVTRGVVLRSGKPGLFATGADVETLGPALDRAEVREAIGRAQRVLARLAALPCPTVAAIDGACLGGGVELALACGSRVASDEPHTRFGMPDVLLGAIPCFGGTVRLVRLVGMRAALDLVLTGRVLDASGAEQMGLVARAVPAAWLIEHAHRRLAELAPAPRRGRPGAPARDRWRPRSVGSWLADGTAAGRGLQIGRARARTRARTGGNYPAPVAALGVLAHAATLPLDVALRLEADWASDVAVGPVCRSLLRAFRLVGSAPGADSPASSGRTGATDGDAAPVERLQIVGAGPAGAELAELASRHGLDVRLRDTAAPALSRALRAVRARNAGRMARGELASHEAAAQLARVHASLDLAGSGRADLAIEMVVEDLDVKRRVFGELEVRLRPEALLATATSSLSVDDLAAGLRHPGRFVGLHFFHPLPRRLLVEVVRGAKTSSATLASAVALMRRLGRIPVVVSDAPGFVVNRVRTAGLREALHLLEDGYRVADVDRSLRSFGMPAGPFETMDEMGIDVLARLVATLSRAFPARILPAPQLEALVAAGRIGRRGAPAARGTGTGFYRGRGRAPDPQAARLIGAAHRRRPARPEALAERVLLAMVNEAAHCLGDGVVAEAGMLDLALLHGADFPPFRGGLLRYADALGLARVEARLNALRAENGERFQPARLVAELAARGGTFTGPADR